MTRSTEITVPVALDDAAFDGITQQWEQAENAVLAVPSSLSAQQVDAMARYLLTKVPHSVAFYLLADLAEQPQIGAGLLEQVFEQGNKACKVTICLRTDLSESLEDKCRKSQDEDVREHYLARIQRPNRHDN